MSNLISKGIHRAVAVPVSTADGQSWAQFGESSEKGTPQVVINFEILDGDDVGRRIAWIGYFTDKTVQRTVESLRFCGFTGDDLAGAVVQQLDQEVGIVVEHEEYDGKTRARVRWVNRAGGEGLKLEKPMDRTKLSQFSAMLKKTVAAVPAVAGKKAERSPAPATTGPSSSSSPADDLMF